MNMLINNFSEGLKFAAVFTVLLFAQPSFAEGNAVENLDFAQVTFVRVLQQGDGSWTLHVTVRHKDDGWDHYADLWQVLDPVSGAVIAKRVLAHPHVGEQPFTRSLANVVVPEASRSIEVQAKCNVHGFGGKQVLVDFNLRSGQDFEVILKE